MEDTKKNPKKSFSLETVLISSSLAIDSSNYLLALFSYPFSGSYIESSSCLLTCDDFSEHSCETTSKCISLEAMTFLCCET